MVLRASGAINALMVRERDPRRLLAEASKILVETRGYQLAWIGLVKPNSKQVVPEASAGNDAGYLDAVSITWDETPTGQRPIPPAGGLPGHGHRSTICTLEGSGDGPRFCFRGRDADDSRFASARSGGGLF